MTVDGKKGLICMLIVGGEERLSVLERVCWYQCEPRMFGGRGGGEECLASKDKRWAGTSLNVYSVVDAVL